MKKYILDTQTLIGIITNSPSISKSIKDDVEYFQNEYYTLSVILQEIVILVQLGKLALDFKIDELTKELEKRNIDIIPLQVTHVKALERLPIVKFNSIEHKDPFDRIIIATSIAERKTIISTDMKFPAYITHGLKLLDARK